MFVAKIDRYGVLCLAFCATLLAAARDAQAQEPTAKVYLTPVASHPDGPFNTGGFYDEAAINGQDVNVLASPGGGRIFLESQVSDWGPSDSAIRSLELRFRASSLLGENADPPNPGCDLTLAMESCLNPADCGQAFESYSPPDCSSNLCSQAWIDSSVPDWRPDFIFANAFGGVSTVADVSDALGPRWSATANNSGEARTDDMGSGYRYYLGALVLDVPSCAAGRYALTLVPFPLTFLHGEDAQVPGLIIPIAEYVAATITITNCDTNADCDDDNLCTDDTCDSQQLCTHTPVSGWNPDKQCCNPPTGATALIPTTLRCNDISCSLGGSSGTLVMEQHPVGTSCDLNDPCTASETCTASGSCVGVEFAGPACQKSRFITLDPADIGGPSAIRVTLTSLHRPDPAYLVPPPDGNFSAFEGEVRWVGPVATCLDSAPFQTTYRCATLQCEPYYSDWTVDLGGEFLHVFGAAVVPSSRYEVAQLPDACTGVEDSCADVRPEPAVTTGRWADIFAPYQVPGVTSVRQPNVTDLTVMLRRLGGLTDFLTRPRALLAGNEFTPGQAPNVNEVILIVDAIKGEGFPYAGPSSCSP
jgi:hypothetical protein